MNKKILSKTIGVGFKKMNADYYQNDNIITCVLTHCGNSCLVANKTIDDLKNRNYAKSNPMIVDKNTMYVLSNVYNNRHYIGIAICCEGDTFDAEIGIKLATERALDELYADNMQVYHDIIQQLDNMKEFILQQKEITMHKYKIMKSRFEEG